MKKVFNFLVLSVCVIALGVSGCSNEDTAEPLEIDFEKVATVKGIAHANYDGEDFATIAYAPVGTKVFLKVKYSDLNTNISSSEYYVMTTTVESNGQFTFDNVPVSNSGLTATLQGDSFTANYTLAREDPNDNTERRKTEPRKYNGVSATTPTLQVGATAYVILEYGSGQLYE